MKNKCVIKKMNLKFKEYHNLTLHYNERLYCVILNVFFNKEISAAFLKKITIDFSIDVCDVLVEYYIRNDTPPDYRIESSFMCILNVSDGRRLARLLPKLDWRTYDFEIIDK